MQLYQFVTSRDLWQLHQAIKPTYSALASKREESEEKGEIEEEVATISRKTEKGKLSKLSTEGKYSVSQARFVTAKKNEIKRRSDDLKSAFNAFEKFVDSNVTKEFVEYFKEENE